MLSQDLHIHTTYSENDKAIDPLQTIELIAKIKHAQVVGISDHFENLTNGSFETYAKTVVDHGLKLGVEVDGHLWTKEAAEYDVDYYIAHCRDSEADYRGLEYLLQTGKPVIVAHPNAFPTDLNRVPPECLIEINNRYVWRDDWLSFYTPHINRFKFVISSDAHQPNWLGQAVAQYAAKELGIKEHLIFES